MEKNQIIYYPLEVGFFESGVFFIFFSQFFLFQMFSLFSQDNESHFSTDGHRWGESCELAQHFHDDFGDLREHPEASEAQ